MGHPIIIQGIEPEALIKQIDENVKARLEALKEQLINQKAGDNLLTRDEACKLLQINQSTLFHWTNKGKVTAYGIGNRRYYKLDELMQSLTKLKVDGGENA